MKRTWRCRLLWHAWTPWKASHRQRLVLEALDGTSPVLVTRGTVWARTCRHCEKNQWKTMKG